MVITTVVRNLPATLKNNRLKNTSKENPYKKESYPESFHGVQSPLIQDGTDQGVHL